MIERVLVTGGAGFIGANLVRMLLAHGVGVRVLDSLEVCGAGLLADQDVELQRGDILDPEAVATACHGVSAIVHLAAQTGVPGSIADPHRDREVNITGTLNLLEAARLRSIDKFIFASSNAPLGRQPPPASEDKAPLPLSPYGASKLAGEGYCLAYHGSWGLETVVLRFANVYGPYSAHKGSVVAKFIREIAAGHGITIDGDGAQTRDFIYVDDLCRAILASLNSSVAGEVFQIATGMETGIAELAEILARLSGQTFAITHVPARRGDIEKNYSAVSKAATVLGWRPEIGLEEGLSKTLAWFEG
jgi:UDP-glucose 4-epimerase